MNVTYRGPRTSGSGLCSIRHTWRMTDGDGTIVAKYENGDGSRRLYATGASDLQELADAVEKILPQDQEFALLAAAVDSDHLFSEVTRYDGRPENTEVRSIREEDVPPYMVAWVTSAR